MMQPNITLSLDLIFSYVMYFFCHLKAFNKIFIMSGYENRTEYMGPSILGINIIQFSEPIEARKLSYADSRLTYSRYL